MNKIFLLDCTLRDGGYVNDWKFGYSTIVNILKKLVASNIDIIECGYYSHTRVRGFDFSIFNSMDELDEILPPKLDRQRFALMINYGECNIESMPVASSNTPIVRVCFHKKDMLSALKFCSELKEKNYIVYVQPMASLNYSDTEFINLIEAVNVIHPDCFYIVDSFGSMELKNFQRMLAIAENNLSDEILLGYHSHNNLQQAYENAKYMVSQNLEHDIILDASVYGMGRGAGNLNMELFSSYLNQSAEGNYIIEPMIDIIDEYLKPIFCENFWGYSMPFYLSAKKNCHPNYASYFSEKNTLSNKSLSELLSSISPSDKALFSEKKAEQYYQNFQRNLVNDKEACIKLAADLKEKKVLILAPGKSLFTEKKIISSFISENHPAVIGINQMADWFEYDYLMFVNEKRFSHYSAKRNVKLILSSNLHCDDPGALVINYSSYLVDNGFVADNPTLMLLKFLHLQGINTVYIAGFDGYKSNADENYFMEGMSFGTPISVKIRKNHAVADSVAVFQTYMKLIFITDSIYIDKNI